MSNGVIYNLDKSTVKKMFTDEQIKDALYQCAGIKAKTARMLGCTWVTINNRINDSEELQQAQIDAREQSLDCAEDVVHTNVKLTKAIQEAGVPVLDKDGNPKLDKEGEPIIKYPTVNDETAKWVLRTQGKHRGYTERTELTGKDGEELVLRFKTRDEDPEKDKE